METIRPEYLLNKVADLIIKRDKSIRVTEDIKNQDVVEDIVEVNDFQGNNYVIMIKKRNKWLKKEKQ